MRPSNVFYSVATGSRRLRLFLTPVGLVVFVGLLLLVIFGGLYLDGVFGFRRLLAGSPGTLLGMILLAGGLVIWAWCVVSFGKAKGTPVPFNPPSELVTTGPYAWSRNPMLTGVFAFLFGMGFLLHSVSIVVIWTPVFVIVNVLELKFIEEPELERRFGERYREYRRRVPMFVPRAPGVSKKR